MAKCPFDGFECGKQTKRKDDYKRWVHHLAVTGDTRVFYTRGDMFEDCKDKEKCIRYINLMKQPPQRIK